MQPSAPTLSVTDLTDAEFTALLVPSRSAPTLPAPPLQLVHRLDFTGRGGCPCGRCCFQRYDAEYVVPETDDDSSGLGSALQYTCSACSGTYTISFLARPDLDESDLLRVLDRRVAS